MMGTIYKRLLQTACVACFAFAGQAATWYVDGTTGDDAAAGTSIATAFKTIQHAINGAEPDDLILVAPGTYAPIVVPTENITIRSTGGAAQTIINGKKREPGRCVTFQEEIVYDGDAWSRREVPSGVLDGFTVQNGVWEDAEDDYNGDGAGVLGGVLKNCIIKNNSTWDGHGGGVARSVLTNCTLLNNSASSGGGVGKSILLDCTLEKNSSYGSVGGGAYECALTNCVLVSNQGQEGGGGAAYSTLFGCTVTGNVARTWELSGGGGGVYECEVYQSTLTDNKCGEGRGGGALSSSLSECVITGNNASLGWGGGASDCMLANCLVVKNTAEEGGGVMYCDVYNCTIVDNRAYSGGGVSGGYVCNSIVHGNTSEDEESDDWCSQLYYSFWNGYLMAEEEDEELLDPMFVDAANGDYRLRTGSPCLDAGSDEYVAGWYDDDDVLHTYPDATGNARIQGPAVDMGAYEGSVDGLIVSARVAGIGSVSPATGILAPGGSFNCKAVFTERPFSHWLLNGEVYSEAAEITLEDIQVDAVLTAVFSAVELHVDAARPDDSGDGFSWATAKRTIQAAIDTAHDGETVWVTNGTYEAINAHEKTLDIRSMNGAEVTIIDAKGRTCCASLGDDVTLRGFTLTGGYGRSSGVGGLNGGTAYDCIISGNKSGDFSGAYNATLYNCIIRDNVLFEGGWYWMDWPVAGAAYCVLNNCAIYNNRSIYTEKYQTPSVGGAYACTLNNCSVGSNYGGYVGGVVESTMYNSIVWSNIGEEGDNDCDAWGVRGDCNCTGDLLEDGEGNISEDPLWVDYVNGDFRLRTGSPCLDTGSDDSVVGETDLNGQPRIQGDAVDMGACEGVVDGIVVSVRANLSGIVSPLTAVVTAGCSATFTAQVPGRQVVWTVEGEEPFIGNSLTLTDIQSDTVVTAELIAATLYVDATAADDSGDGLTLATAKRTIQAAIDSTYLGDVVLVEAGTYTPINVKGKTVAIRSARGASRTIIDGGGVSCCAVLGARGNAMGGTLIGFTLQNGMGIVDDEESSGGGAYLGQLRQCVLKNNRADYGGAAYESILTDCQLSNNQAVEAGGGAYMGELYNCTLFDNEADIGGGYAGSVLYGCVVRDNRARVGGGGSGGNLFNCLMIGNQAEEYGGGSHSGYLHYCTVSDNRSVEGAGLSYSEAYNSIIWGNFDFEGEPVDMFESYGTFCCCPSDELWGDGNITDDPLFVNPVKGNYRLQADSPCINAGNQEYLDVEWFEYDFDLAGNDRVYGDAIDMGAYEYVPDEGGITFSIDGEALDVVVSEAFLADASQAEADSVVAALSGAELNAEAIGEVLQNADLLGLTLAELAAGDAVLAFEPQLAIAHVELSVGDALELVLQVTLANGIDAEEAGALARAQSAERAVLCVYGGESPTEVNVLLAEVPLSDAVDGEVAVSLEDSAAAYFFRAVLCPVE